MKRNKKVELNLNIEFGRSVLFTIFTDRISTGIICSIPRSERWGRNYPITSTYHVPVGKTAYKERANIAHSRFLSHPGSHINGP